MAHTGRALWPCMRSEMCVRLRARNSKPSRRAPSTSATSSGDGPCGMPHVWLRVWGSYSISKTFPVTMCNLWKSRSATGAGALNEKLRWRLCSDKLLYVQHNLCDSQSS